MAAHFLDALTITAQNGYVHEVFPLQGLCRGTWTCVQLGAALRSHAPGAGGRTRLDHAIHTRNLPRLRWLLSCGALPSSAALRRAILLRSAPLCTALLAAPSGGSSLATAELLELAAGCGAAPVLAALLAVVPASLPLPTALECLLLVCASEACALELLCPARCSALVRSLQQPKLLATVLAKRGWVLALRRLLAAGMPALHFSSQDILMEALLSSAPHGSVAFARELFALGARASPSPPFSTYLRRLCLQPQAMRCLLRAAAAGGWLGEEGAWLAPHALPAPLHAGTAPAAAMTLCSAILVCAAANSCTVDGACGLAVLKEAGKWWRVFGGASAQARLGALELARQACLTAAIFSDCSKAQAACEGCASALAVLQQLHQAGASEPFAAFLHRPLPLCQRIDLGVAPRAAANAPAAAHMTPPVVLAAAALGHAPALSEALLRVLLQDEGLTPRAALEELVVNARAEGPGQHTALEVAAALAQGAGGGRVIALLLEAGARDGGRGEPLSTLALRTAQCSDAEKAAQLTPLLCSFSLGASAALVGEQGEEKCEENLVALLLAGGAAAALELQEHLEHLLLLSSSARAPGAPPPARLLHSLRLLLLRHVCCSELLRDASRTEALVQGLQALLTALAAAHGQGAVLSLISAPAPTGSEQPLERSAASAGQDGADTLLTAACDCPYAHAGALVACLLRSARSAGCAALPQWEWGRALHNAARRGSAGSLQALLGGAGCEGGGGAPPPGWRCGKRERGAGGRRPSCRLQWGGTWRLWACCWLRAQA